MSKKLIAGVGAVAALGVAALPVLSAFAVDATTVVRVTVGEGVNCQSAVNNVVDAIVDFGTKLPGEKGAQAFTVTGSTNSEAGFTLTGAAGALEIGSLSGDVWTKDTSDNTTIPYAASETQGDWWLTTSENSGVVINGTGAVLTTATREEKSFGLTANIWISNTQKQGVYQGEIEWTCAAN